MAEGRVRNEGGGYGFAMKMEYFITDQQGNVRVSFEDNNGTVALRQENSYYAFGMQMAGGYIPGTNPNKKLYNAGSEWQDDIEGLADYYSTFFREYDPIIGRFNGVDPMAVLTDAITTYAYANNNPVMLNDPLGDYPAAKPTPQWILDMQAEYKSWHDSRYGNNLPDRGWDLGSDGDPMGLGGGIGTYRSGFVGNGDNYYTGINSTKNGIFWQSLWYMADGKNVTFHNGSGDGFTGSPYTYCNKKNTGCYDSNIDEGAERYNSYTGETYYRKINMTVDLAGLASTTQGGDNDLDNWQTGLGAADVAWGAKEELINYAGKSSSAINNMKYVKGVKVVSKGLFWTQAGLSTYNAVSAWRNSDRDWTTNQGNKWGVTTKAALDIAIGAISVWGGPIGWLIGGAYFIADAAGAFDSWSKPEN